MTKRKRFIRVARSWKPVSIASSRLFINVAQSGELSHQSEAGEYSASSTVASPSLRQGTSRRRKRIIRGSTDALIVPTTKTRMTGNITAYLAMSSPFSCCQSLRSTSNMFIPSFCSACHSYGKRVDSRLQKQTP